MRRTGWALMVLVGWSLACHSSTPSGGPTTPSMASAPSPAPSPSPSPSPTPLPPLPTTNALRVDLTLNGAKFGSFACDSGLFVETTVENLSSRPIRLDRLYVHFSPTRGGCLEQSAEIDPYLSLRLDAGARVQVRRFDAAGPLCEDVYAAGCAWTATAAVASDVGVAQDEIDFSAYRATSACDGGVPRLWMPADGAIVRGVVDVAASAPETRYCSAMSARAIAQGFSETGRLVFTSYGLDLDDRFHWDTTQFPNGRYWLSAFQNCCGISSRAIQVTVRN